MNEWEVPTFNLFFRILGMDLDACSIPIRDASLTGTKPQVFISETCALYARLVVVTPSARRKQHTGATPLWPPCLLRLKGHLHVVTVPPPGAFSDGTLAVSSGVIGPLEK